MKNKKTLLLFLILIFSGFAYAWEFKWEPEEEQEFTFSGFFISDEDFNLTMEQVFTDSSQFVMYGGYDSDWQELTACDWDSEGCDNPPNEDTNLFRPPIGNNCILKNLYTENTFDSGESKHETTMTLNCYPGEYELPAKFFHYDTLNNYRPVIGLEEEETFYFEVYPKDSIKIKSFEVTPEKLRRGGTVDFNAVVENRYDSNYFDVQVRFEVFDEDDNSKTIQILTKRILSLQEEKFSGSMDTSSLQEKKQFKVVAKAYLVVNEELQADGQPVNDVQERFFSVLEQEDKLQTFPETDFITIAILLFAVLFILRRK